jgi:hypothetical protein
MKKMISLVGIIVMLLGIVFLSLPAADTGIDTSYNGDDGGSGAGGADLYDRDSHTCVSDETKTEYTCTSPGDELCTVQNCP